MTALPIGRAVFTDNIICFVLLWLYYIRVIFASSLQIFKFLKKVLNFFQEILCFP